MRFEPYWVALLATPFLIRAIQTSTRGKYAKAKAGRLMFFAPGVAGLCFIGALLGIAIAVGGWNQGARTTTTVLGCLFILCSVLLWPPTLAMDEVGVSANFVWRLPKRLRYADIRFATKDVGEIRVVGERTEITHTKHHIDAGRFESELRKRGVEF